MISPGSALLSPRGKVLENGMPRFFRRLAEGVFDEDDVRRRAHELADFVARRARAYGLAAPVAVGYSNGANIAAAMLLLRPEVLAGAVLLRAMVPLRDPPQGGARWQAGAAAVRAAPIRSCRREFGKACGAVVAKPGRGRPQGPAGGPSIVAGRRELGQDLDERTVVASVCVSVHAGDNGSNNGDDDDKSYTRLDLDQVVVLLVDHQARLMSLVRDYDPDQFKNNMLAVADLAAYYRLPTILTTSFEDGPSGPIMPELKAKFPDAPFIARPGQIKASDNPDFVAAVKATGRRQLIIAGVVTEVLRRLRRLISQRCGRVRGFRDHGCVRHLQRSRAGCRLETGWPHGACNW